MARTLITTGVALFLMPYMIWRLGPEKYGLWVIILLFSTRGYLAIAELGLEGTLVRYLSRYHADGDIDAFKRLLFSGFALFVAMGVFWGVVLIFFGKLAMPGLFGVPTAFTEELVLAITIYAFSYLVHFPMFVLRAFYKAVQDYFRLELWEVLRTLVFAAGVVVVLGVSDSLVYVVAVDCSVYAVFVLILAVMSLRWHSDVYTLNPRWFSVASLRAVVGFAGYAFACRASGIVFRMGPTLLVGLLLGPAQVTLFTVVQRIPNTVRMFLGPINAAALPSAVRLEAKESAQRLRGFILKGTRMSYLLLTPLVVGLWVYAEEVLTLWVGAEFEVGADYMRAILVWSYISCLVSFGSSTFTQKNQYKRSLPISLVANLVLIAVALALVEFGDLWAVLIALLVSGTLMVAGYLWILVDSHAIRPREFLKTVIDAPVLRAGALTLALFILVGAIVPSRNLLDLLIISSVVSAIYLTWMYWFAFDGTERRALGSFVSAGLRRG